MGPRAFARAADDRALAVLHALVAADMNRVNAIILKRMESPVALIPELAGHLIASGGKRLRPLLTLASAKLVGYEGTRQCELAACVEFIHTATLLHDDVVDQSVLRRGVSAANAIWGNKAPVLVGDFLFSRAFELMVEDGSLKVLKILSRASSVIAEGEVMQLLTSNNTDTTEDAYLKVVDAKTAELFAAACEVSAVVAERPGVEEESLRAFGRNLGIAFQLVDDVLDYSSRDAVLGKTVGDDFREGKITLPVILAFQRGTDEERAFWKRTLEDGEQTEGDLARAVALVGRRQALEDTLKRARHFAAIAGDALGRFRECEVKQALLDIAEFSVKRAY
ncbi:MAG TPA: polyprenyl synthetase family protein [Sphingomonadales bacterium]|nr:polyprenyl synthetase family protein [Sphingomonadales bacterium]